MTMRDLLPWGRSRGTQALTPYREEGRDPFLTFHREFDRLFDDFFRSFDGRLPAMGGGRGMGTWPSVEVSDLEDEIKVTTEVPGLDEKNIEVLLDDGVLTLRGEKTSENDGAQFSERFYGRVERRIPLGVEVEEDKVEAEFRNGVLTVTLPKSPEAQAQVKRIEIKH